LEGRCDKHLFERAADLCRECGHEFCPECLVYAFGPKQPPYCVPCAVSAAGIRRTAGNVPAMSTRDKKVRLKQRQATIRAAAREQRGAAKAAKKSGHADGNGAGEPVAADPPATVSSYTWTEVRASFVPAKGGGVAVAVAMPAPVDTVPFEWQALEPGPIPTQPWYEPRFDTRALMPLGMSVQYEESYEAAETAAARVVPPPMTGYRPRTRADVFEWGVGDAVFPHVAAG
jgi:hypothetical protein